MSFCGFSVIFKKSCYVEYLQTAIALGISFEPLTLFWKILQKSQENTCCDVLQASKTHKNTSVFPCDFCKIIQNRYTMEHLWKYCIKSNIFR